jgi:PAS domain S-box-containing protein
VADRKLRESEAQLRVLTEAMPQIVWTAQPDGRLDYFNERWAEYSGISGELPLNDGWQRAVHSDDLPGLRTAWTGHVANGAPFEAEFRILRDSDAHYRWHLTRALAVLDSAGQITKWYGTMTDIHDRKLAEQALERSNHALREFAYAAGHDLQEPLRNVAIASALLKRNFNGRIDADAERLLATNVEGAQRMHHMVKDLLAYTTVVEHTIGVAPLCQASAALTQAVANLAQSIKETDASVTYDQLPQIRIHEIHLMQLFQNLISNSLKYRHPARRPAIHVTADHRGGVWIFAVRDNGIGFDPIYSNRIFGIFKRLHARDEYAGNGIGLAICTRIVQHYGGRIWASAEPGSGASFSFELSAA